jgi:hypothetical protein
VADWRSITGEHTIRPEARARVLTWRAWHALPAAADVRGLMHFPGYSALVMLAVMLLALAVRIPFFVDSDFPLNDGGLFFVMSQEVAASQFALPSSTSYNADNAPFAYPPLSFYVAAAASAALHIPLIAVMRYLPLLANLLTIVAFVALARSLLGSQYAVLFAACAFALLPRSYEWLIMGGGLTRSLGFLFAMTVLAQAVALYRSPSALRIATAGILASLTILTHLEMGLFLIYSLALFFLAYGRTWRGLRTSVLVGLWVVPLTAPWWLTVASHHGWAPYFAASATAGWSNIQESLETLRDFMFPELQPFLSVVGGLAALGAAACVLRRQVLPILWLPCIFIFTPRSAPTEATVPLALLIGIGLADVVLPGLADVARRSSLPRLPGLADWWADAVAPLERRSLAATAAGTVMLGYAILPHWSPAHFGTYALEALPPAERQAMVWVSEHTDESSAFLVLTPKVSWEGDYILEWFPALARRKSVLTPQGSEWLPAQTHARRACLYNQLRAQAMGSLDELEDWLSRLHVRFTHVYITKLTTGPADLDPLRNGLLSSPRYRVLLDTPGASVLERRTSLPGPWLSFDEPPISGDCQTLADQPDDVQAAFYAAHGELAPWVWVEQHTSDARRRRK